MGRDDTELINRSYPCNAKRVEYDRHYDRAHAVNPRDIYKLRHESQYRCKDKNNHAERAREDTAKDYNKRNNRMVQQSPVNPAKPARRAGQHYRNTISSAGGKNADYGQFTHGG